MSMQVSLAIFSVAGLVVIGEGAPPLVNDASLSFKRELVARVPSVGSVSDIWLDRAEGAMIVAGTCGAFVFDLGSNAVTGEVVFDLPCPPFLPAAVRDVDGDGVREFVRFATGWIGPTAVLEPAGDVRWSNERPASCDQVLDVDSDGKVEILVSEEDRDYVSLLDFRGRVLWSREWKGRIGSCVELDVEPDGTKELLYVNGKELVVCGSNGVEVRSLPIPEGAYASRVELVSDPSKLDGAKVVIGASVSGEARYFGVSEDVTSIVGRYKEVEVRAPVRGIWRNGGPLGLGVVLNNVGRQSGVAGYESSELEVAVYDRRMVCLFREQMGGTEARGAVLYSAVLVVSEDPYTFVVGYGDALWKFTAEP